MTFLHTASIKKQIGAETRYHECPDAPFELFEKTGDVSYFDTSTNTTGTQLQGHFTGRKDSTSSTRRVGELWP